MNFKLLKRKEIWVDSINPAIAVLAAIETLCAVSDFGLDDFIEINQWMIKLLIILGVLLATWVLVAVVKCIRYSNSIKLNINNIIIEIKEGDLFSTNDWKVIPFNEFFDTQVDDIVIAHNTLNGIFIDRHVENIEKLENTIENAPIIRSITRRQVNNKVCHQLGRIIPFENQYLLLAFSHFEENQAKLTHSQYEACLRTMWREISRTYANRPVFLPLLGSGITRFDNPVIKTEQQLLKCLLCTLKTSNVTINQKISIVLTPSAIKKVNLYELKKQFS